MVVQNLFTLLMFIEDKNMTEVANVAENVDTINTLKKEILKLKTVHIIRDFNDVKRACELAEIKQNLTGTLDTKADKIDEEMDELDKLRELYRSRPCTHQFKKGAKNGTMCGKTRCRDHPKIKIPEYLKKRAEIEEKYRKLEEEEGNESQESKQNKELAEAHKGKCQFILKNASNLLESAKPFDANDPDVQKCINALTGIIRNLETGSFKIEKWIQNEKI